MSLIRSGSRITVLVGIESIGASKLSAPFPLYGLAKEPSLIQNKESCYEKGK